MKAVIVAKRGADRVRNGHLWIYRSDVVNTGDATGGSVVAVHDPHGNFVGQALFSDASEISLRFLSRTEEVIDREWWRARILEAAGRRQGLSADTNAYRLVHSEGDLLPSLVIDRYADVLVLQTLSQGTEAVKSMLLEILIEEFAPRAVLERNDVRVRAIEGLELAAGTLYGEPPAEIKVVQNGVQYLVASFGSQKTGLFLDQRENHLAARTVARGSALDCFTFGGGFALSLAAVCDSVIGLDISGDAMNAARRNAELNQLTNVEFREANVFDALREMESAEQKFDTIVLDPPAFAKSRASLKAAARGYKEINLRALKLLKRDGILVTCTCSYHVSEEMFIRILAEAANDARRRVQILEKRMQAGDHPVLLGVPETYYLKCLIARMAD